MEHNLSDTNFFGTEKIGKILLKIAPPVMIAQLIQALYNIVDSFFIGKYSVNALAALSVIFPLQFIIIAVAVGTGVGVNTYMARCYAQGKEKEANNTAGTGMVLELISWIIFSILAVLVMKPYFRISLTSPEAVSYAITYGRIVCVGSIGAFLEGNWSKVHQAKGNMKLPMIAQVTGAVVNVIFDPLLIFGIGFFPEMGIAGAAVATILGQFASALITGIHGFRKPPAIHEIPHYAKLIYRYGYSSILMQALCTVYIVILNIILATFSDAAVTVLGLYYKLQTFFFIPLLGLQTCIVPVLSYNYARKSYGRCRETMKDSILISLSFMAVGFVCFAFFPKPLIHIFSSDPEVLQIGKIAFPIIGPSFFGAVFSLIMPVFFQAIGKGFASLMLSLTRQIFCLIPIFWLLSLIGLNETWLAFPLSETIAGGIGFALYWRQVHRWV